MDEKALSGKHGPCPLCGGRDRFRFDDKDGRGTYFCSGCGAGDGVRLAMGITGLSFANLRSLGSGRTLTLVDGRRHVGSQGGNLAVDVDTIPRLLIQNVEIITGGASSVYGADAVSGVVIFILMKDFEGLEIDAARP